MSTTRDYAAGVYDSQHGFVITGGSGGAEALSSAERTFDGITFTPFLEMPGKMGGHCLVSLKNGNLISIDDSSTYLFHGSNNSWTTAASMPSYKSGKRFKESMHMIIATCIL